MIVNTDPSSNGFWNRWLLANNKNELEAKQIKEVIQSLKLKHDFAMDQSKQDELLKDVIAYHNKKEKNRSLESSNSFRKLAIAASFTFLILVGGFLLYHNLNSNHQNTPIVSIDLKTKNVPSGAKLTLQLPDGTLVKLNSNTSITYPEKFTDTIRMVTLDGEAFFEVVKDTLAPFIIKSKYAETVVLGTSFNFKSIENEEKVEVAVVTGKVKLINNFGKEQTLSSYQKGIVQNDTEQINIYEFDVKKEIGWKDGILIFEKDKYEEIFEKLSSWYGVEFIITPSTKLTGVYSGEYRNESLEHVLEGIAYSSEFKYIINGKKITIYN